MADENRRPGEPFAWEREYDWSPRLPPPDAPLPPLAPEKYVAFKTGGRMSLAEYAAWSDISPTEARRWIVSVAARERADVRLRRLLG